MVKYDVDCRWYETFLFVADALHKFKKIVWWKICLAYSSDISFQLHIIYMSCRQVLTPVNNVQLLSKLEILDKLRLVTFHKQQHKESATLELVHTSSRETWVLMTLTQKALKMKTLIPECTLFLRHHETQMFHSYLWINLIVIIGNILTAESTRCLTHKH